MTEKDMLTMEVAKRIRKSMEEKKMNATELSKASGVGKSDLSNYLNGKYRPKQDKIVLLAAALEVDPVWLGAIDIQLEAHEQAKLLSENANDQSENVLKLLSPDGLRKVYDYARLVLLSERTKE